MRAPAVEAHEPQKTLAATVVTVLNRLITVGLL